MALGAELRGRGAPCARGGGHALAVAGAAAVLGCGGRGEAAVASAPAAAANCTWEPLRVVRRGAHTVYERVMDRRRGDGVLAADWAESSPVEQATTCEAFTRGACNFSVPFPSYDCLVNCVAAVEECVRLNPHTAGVDPFVAPHVCRSCGIPACADCIYSEGSGEARCRRCFDGFVGFDGHEGHWRRCTLRSEGPLNVFFAVVLGMLLLLALAIGVVICVGVYREMVPIVQKFGQSHAPRPGSGLTRLWVKHEVSEERVLAQRNIQAIQQGLFYSLTSSIKFSSLRSTEHRHNSDKDIRQRSSLTSQFWDTSVQDLGLGLQLFFRSQQFLMVVAFIMWFTAVTHHQQITRVLESLSQPGKCGVAGAELERLGRHQVMAAEAQSKCCLTLWAVLLLLSWGFHWSQRLFIVEYDKKTLSAQDYTIKLHGLPPEMTSERKLKEVLERELHMQDKIYGVSICYNIRALKASGVDPKRIEDMIEHIVEVDDIANGWCNEEVSSPTHSLQEALMKDREELEGLLLEGKLKGSGVAFVTFKRQRHMVQVVQQHRGIGVSAFDSNGEGEGGRMMSAARTSKTQSGKSGSISLRAVQSVQLAILEDTYIEDVVSVEEARCEPGGIRFFNYKESFQNQRQYVFLPLRMLGYFGLFTVIAHEFYLTAVKPWQDHFVEGAESSKAVLLAGRFVLLWNFCMQSVVHVEVERSYFIRAASIDQHAFVFNTMMFLFANGNMIRQECYREGIRWTLNPPRSTEESSEDWWHWNRKSVESALIERSVGQNLVQIMTEQIMLLYVLGEVASVLLPVTVNWVTLRLVYGQYISGRALVCARRLLRPLLPRSSRPDVVTAREAEKAQLLMPLLLWMEYTYIVVFTAMAVMTFFFITDQSTTICGWLIVFSLIFYAWQRYVILWLYSPAMYDSDHSYRAFIRVWGIVVSIIPTASVWWSWRRGMIREVPFTVLMIIIVYILALLVYHYGLAGINWLTGGRKTTVDDFRGTRDPGYVAVMEENGSSWWNLNPIYVLKNRHCPNLEGHEVHSDVKCWPGWQESKGFFELGKEFRHEPRKKWMMSHGKSSVQQLMASFGPEDKVRAGAMLFTTTLHAFSQ